MNEETALKLIEAIYKLTERLPNTSALDRYRDFMSPPSSHKLPPAPQFPKYYDRYGTWGGCGPNTSGYVAPLGQGTC